MQDGGNADKRNIREARFDRSFLPEAKIEFALLSDTHYMIDPGTDAVEFESRRLQSTRIQSTLRLLTSLDISFVVHLGDLVQEYPERGGYDRAMIEARAQFARFGVSCLMVAGNHDVGDKPDPTMPTDWVSAASLKAYHEMFGRSWYSWDTGDIHCIVLNSQILNSELTEATEQRQWLESDLKTHPGRRIIMFMHLPPYLENDGEPALGHYDNIDEPDRSWLLYLVRTYRVEAVFAGHSHFSFFDRMEDTRYYIAASTSFTRPGFSECFSSSPPAEQGRNDMGKLGFYLVRIVKNGLRVHFIRTRGETERIEGETEACRLITRLSPDLPNSPLGISLRHPLAQRVDIPIAFPSVIRQRMRNDYPLLSCVELGVQYIRVPAADLVDAFQRRRLEILRDEGVHISAVRQWCDHQALPDGLAHQGDLIDGLELQMLGTPYPEEKMLDDLQRAKEHSTLPITLSTVIPRERIHGKQHNRPRFGYRPSELPELNRMLATKNVRIDRVLCRVDPDVDPWDVMWRIPGSDSLNQIQAVDWLLEVQTTNSNFQNVRVAEAIFASTLCPGSRIFIDPLVDLDRTMDVAHGLMDRLCNPRPAFEVVRSLNTILFAFPEEYRPIDVMAYEQVRILGLRGNAVTRYLFLPVHSGHVISLTNWLKGHMTNRIIPQGKCYQLIRSTSLCLDRMRHTTSAEAFPIDGPVLLVFPNSDTSQNQEL